MITCLYLIPKQGNNNPKEKVHYSNICLPVTCTKQDGAGNGSGRGAGGEYSARSLDLKELSIC